MSKITNKYSAEVRERPVHIVREHEGRHESRWTAIVSISSMISCAPQKLNEWAKRAKIDSGHRAGATTEIAEKMNALERENRELRQANEILRKGERLFCPGGARPPTEIMGAFIDDHREEHGVEPNCKGFPIIPLTYCERLAKQMDPSRQSARAQRDADLGEKYSEAGMFCVFSSNHIPASEGAGDDSALLSYVVVKGNIVDNRRHGRLGHGRGAVPGPGNATVIGGDGG